MTITMLVIENESANGAESHALIQRIALSDSIYPMYIHMYQCITNKSER